MEVPEMEIFCLDKRSNRIFIAEVMKDFLVYGRIVLSPDETGLILRR
jgi:hypothetical protein